MRRCIALFLIFFLWMRPAQAEPMREFVMSCSYGVLAGTIVGAATLAFSEQPGDNLNKVARGASLGLYAGILLGLYVVYGVGGDDDDAADAAAVTQVPNFYLQPVFSSEMKLAGASAQYSVLRF